MHVPTAPALILGGLLSVTALDVGVLANHRPAPAASHSAGSHHVASRLVASAAVREVMPAVTRPPLPHAAARTAAPPRRGPAHRPAHRAVARPTQPSMPHARRVGGTTQADLAAAVRRLRGYQPGTVRWQLSTHYGSWGTADWYGNVIYISPKVPHRLLLSVVTHEWDHILSVRAYGGDVDAAVAAMNQFFGGTGLVGAERAADCMALLSGAIWTHYTACGSDAWRAGARLLLQGRQL